MANTAFGHDATLTTPGSTTDTALVRWANTSGTSLNNTINILSDGSNITLNARGEVRFSDADSSHYIAFESPATVGTSYTMTLPADLPAADEVLTVTSYSGGAGVLEWAAASAGAALSGSTNNTIVTVTGANAMIGEANLTFDGTNLTIGTGNVIIGTSGKGIDFSAATPDESGAGSMSSEILDDYEEGTWTPVLEDNSGAGSTSYNTQNGRYTKIGNMVHLVAVMVVNTQSGVTGSENARMGGLPFTILSLATGEPTFCCIGDGFGSGVTTGEGIAGIGETNGQRISLSINDTNGNTPMTCDEVSNSATVRLTGSYFIQ